jgi:hypothetical protein
MDGGALEIATVYIYEGSSGIREDCFLKEVILYLIPMSYKCFILTTKKTFGHIMLRLAVLLLIHIVIMVLKQKNRRRPSTNLSYKTVQLVNFDGTSNKSVFTKIDMKICFHVILISAIYIVYQTSLKQIYFICEKYLNHATLKIKSVLTILH